jgi:ABC-type glutathione transport system ATPase component
MTDQIPLIEISGLGKRFAKRALVQTTDFALRDIDLTVARGEVVGILGESGSGKSTLANIITLLTGFDSGRYLWKGRDVAGFDRTARFAFKSQVQIIFQDPYGSLNPRATVRGSLREAVGLHHPGLRGAEMDARIAALMDEVGLPVEALGRYPHEFSGGQRQRIAIARALAVGPEVLVCDEPLSSLDVSIQAQVLQLFVRLIRERGLTMIFISHDINVTRLLCDRVHVMNAGRIVEHGPTEKILTDPQDAYTARLLASVY